MHHAGSPAILAAGLEDGHLPTQPPFYSILIKSSLIVVALPKGITSPVCTTHSRHPFSYLVSHLILRIVSRKGIAADGFDDLSPMVDVCAFVHVLGAVAVDFLQGYFTCIIRHVAKKRNPKGPGGPHRDLELVLGNPDGGVP